MGAGLNYNTCKYPCQLQVCKFSLQFVVRMEKEWNSTEEEKPSLGHHAISRGQEMEASRVGEERTWLHSE